MSVDLLTHDIATGIKPLTFSCFHLRSLLNVRLPMAPLLKCLYLTLRISIFGLSFRALNFLGF